MAQNQSSKGILAVVLIIIAIGVFGYRYATREKPEVIEEDIAQKNESIAALEEIFGKVGSKKWSDASLWVNGRAAQNFAPVAEEVFSNSPSISNVKVLDSGVDEENDHAPFLTLEVTGVDVCINVSLNKNKEGKLVLYSVQKTMVNVKSFKKY